MDSEILKLLSDMSGLGIAGMLILIIFYLVNKKKSNTDNDINVGYSSIMENIGVLEEQLSTIKGNHLDHLQSDTTRILNIVIEQGRVQSEANAKMITLLEDIRSRAK